jgi:hypothetical protein
MVKLIYPTHVKKYTGTICKIENKEGYSYSVRIFTLSLFFTKSYSSYDAACYSLREQNIKHGLRIKNLIREYDDHLEVELTQNQRTKVSKEHLDLIQKYIWYFVGGYARAFIDGKSVALHNLIASVDRGIRHRNGDRLDNRPENLLGVWRKPLLELEVLERLLPVS